MMSLRHWSWGFFCAAVLLFSSSVSATDFGDYWRDRPLRIVTQNLFIGADLDDLLAEGPGDFLLGILGSNPPARLKVLAQQILRQRPHVVGLQEVALIRYQEPGDFGPLTDGKYPFPNAEETYLDFLEVLLGELNARGPLYKVAAVQRNIDAELPTGAVPGLCGSGCDVRVTDRDVILARWDVPVANLTAGIYNNLRILDFQNTPFPVRRGFAVIKAWVGGKTFAIANTHLENQGVTGVVQAFQAADLISELNSIDLPTVVLGDLNSDPSDRDPSFPVLLSPYNQFEAAKFKDAWVERVNYDSSVGDSGNTCCRSDLSNMNALLEKRIDLVLFRGKLSDKSSDSWRVRARLIGDQPLDPPIPAIPPIPPGIYWASDHAGVAAKLRMR